MCTALLRQHAGSSGTSILQADGKHPGRHSVVLQEATSPVRNSRGLSTYIEQVESLAQGYLCKVYFCLIAPSPIGHLSCKAAEQQQKSRNSETTAGRQLHGSTGGVSPGKRRRSAAVDLLVGELPFWTFHPAYANHKRFSATAAHPSHPAVSSTCTDRSPQFSACHCSYYLHTDLS